MVLSKQQIDKYSSYAVYGFELISLLERIAPNDPSAEVKADICIPELVITAEDIDYILEADEVDNDLAREIRERAATSILIQSYPDPEHFWHHHQFVTSWVEKLRAEVEFDREVKHEQTDHR